MIYLTLNDNEEWTQSEPIVNELCRKVYGSFVEGYAYEEVIYTEDEEEPVFIETKLWLRKHLGSVAEKEIRDFVLSGAIEANEVKVVLDMVRDRIAIDLELSDPLYAASMALLESVSIITTEHATQLIELGGHNANNYLTT